MAQDCHAAFCDVWITRFTILRVDETRPCTCGFRKRSAERNTRTVSPLNMTDDDFLRTMKIAPQGETK